MSYFYDLTQESVHFIEEEDSEAELSCTQKPKKKSHPGAATANATPATKHDDSPCPKTTNDPEICQEEKNSTFHAQAEEKTNRVEGHVNQGGTPAPTYDNNLLQEHHNVLDLKSSSIKLLLLRQDKSEQGDTRLVLEKIWDLKNPVEIGRRLSQSTEITNGLFNDRLVSRKHATVYVEDDKVVFQDVGSSHGTFVNGQRVLTCRELFDGDRLNLGQFSSGKAPYIVQIIRGANQKIGDDTKAEQCASSESKKRKHEADGIDDVAYFIFDSLDNVENRIVKRIRASSAISTIVGGVVGGLTVGCAIVGLANMG